jgi:glucose-6-phosphate 1-epimerase
MIRLDNHVVFGPVVTIEITDGSRVSVALYGGHLISWVPSDGRERLFLSSKANAVGAIRGGIPICFPQFAGLGDLPKHGYARTSIWRHREGGRFVLDVRPNSWSGWPHPCALLLDVGLGPATLTLSLTVENVGIDLISFTGAMHTYLSVEDVDLISVDGLSGCEVFGRNARQNGPVIFDGEVDLSLIDPVRPATIRSEGNELFLCAQTGFADTVVWNIGAEKAGGLADLGAEEWRRYVCVEAAIVAEPVTVEAGARWTGTQTLIALDL